MCDFIDCKTYTRNGLEKCSRKPISQSLPPHPCSTTSGWTLDLCLHAPLLIPKINSSAHLCPSNTTLTPTTGGILSEKNVPLWLHGETSVWPFHLRPSLSALSHPRLLHPDFNMIMQGNEGRTVKRQVVVISGRKICKKQVSVWQKYTN